MVRIFPLVISLCLSIFFWPLTGMAAEVSPDLARLVAENTVNHHIALYGQWGEAHTARVDSRTAVRYRDTLIAYNFDVSPSGHVLVAAHDEFSPVLLYSPTSEFRVERTGTPGALESWIVIESYESLYGTGAMPDSGSSGLRALQTASAKDRIEQSWDRFGSETAVWTASDSGRAAIKSDETVGPLLTTAWSQSYPYNSQTPSDSGCSNTLTGCVATAFSQLLAYWEWPPRGEGSHSYSWQPSSGGTQTLSADFDHAYDWDSMPDRLDGSSTNAEIDAVARLMADMGVATEMIYGCSSSGSYAYADDILDVHFRYKSSMEQHSRSNYTSDQWFALLKAELDAVPPRPVVLSVFLANYSGGHETIVDGYQSGLTDKVHINFGWSGAYNGYYDITHNFSTGSYTWGSTFQVAVTKIEPHNTAPSANAGADRTAAEGELVSLAGSGVDPDGAAITAYKWTQIEGPRVVLSDDTSNNPSFTMPELDEETPLTFKLRVTDNLGAIAEDTVIVRKGDSAGGGNVQDASDGVSSGSVSGGASNNTGSSGGGGGGGPCFIGTLLF